MIRNLFSLWPLSSLKRRYYERDWVGVWYELLKERGENDQCVVGRGRFKNDELSDVQTYEYSHSLMDGSASIPYYLTKLGAEREPVLSSYKKKITCLDHLKLTFKAKDISPANKPAWIENNDITPKDNYEFVVKALDRKQTSRFNTYLKENKLSQNIVILELINHYIFDLINEDSQSTAYSWLLPINIRGIITKKNLYENHTSFVQLRLNAKDSYHSIRKAFSQKVKTLNHIGLWWVHHIGVLFGKKYMRKLSKNSASKNFWIGTFSNVGSWEVHDKGYDSLGEDEIWFATTPGSKNFPVGLVAMEFNGKLSLTLKIHPSICQDNVECAKTILNKICHDIVTNYS